MEWLLLIFASMLFLAYANGANDNFKGVATLLGSNTLSHRNSLIWATITTLAGSLTAAFFATELARVFSGKGLVPDALITAPEFMLSVMIGAALTVFVAAKAGIPISTTHSLIGGLVGAGFVASGNDLNLDALGQTYIIPLALSPLIAVAVAATLYLILTTIRKRLRINKHSCLCIGERRLDVAVPEGIAPSVVLSTLDIVIDEQENCDVKSIELYQGRMLGFGIQRTIDVMHVLSAGAVSFARGLHDTPKIVGVAMAAGALDLHWITFIAAIAMALGGIFQSRKIAKTMSEDITSINHGQGFAANIVTAVMVLFASKWGVPVSTTHVSCGSIFGIGTINGKTNWSIVRGIVLAWVLTLPIAAAISAIAYGVSTI
ncbi:MAG: inorganic phosphate transporter [Mariprofundaceae bacterium]